jgi:hypothetical protein
MCKEISERGRTVYTPEGLKAFLSTPLPVFTGRTGFAPLQLGDYKSVMGA